MKEDSDDLAAQHQERAHGHGAAPGVSRVREFAPVINAYMVEDVLIDSGRRWDRKRIFKALEGRDISLVALTHAHGDRVLEEGDEVAGFRIIHAPGHSPGEVIFFRESDRVAICGDVIRN